MYRKLNFQPGGLAVSEKSNDQVVGTDLVMYDQRISGSKREEADQRKSMKGLTPEPKKKHGMFNSSTSTSAGHQPRQDQ